VLLRAAAALVLLLSAVAAAVPPRLEVEAPPELAAEARIVKGVDPASFVNAQEMTGTLEPGPPIPVTLEPEGSAVARGTPAYITGFARPDGTIVLFPKRAPRYPSEGLPEVLRHEVAHVLLFRASRGGTLPRWFHEGVAMVAARPFGFEDRTRLALELFRDDVSLHETEALFEKDERSVARAYTLAGAFVDELLDRYGHGLPAALAHGVASGEPFEAVFERVTGAPLALEEWRWRRSRRSWERWAVVATSSATLWAGITVLAIVAIARRRRRDALLRRLDEETLPPPDEPLPVEEGEEPQGWVH
jgi:hypothetical protein